MEVKPLSIKCPLHPKERLVRLDIEFGTEKELYCIECLLKVDNAVPLLNILKPIDDFVDTAARYYEDHRHMMKEDQEVPADYFEIINQETQNFEALSKAIEDEKKKVQFKFDELTKDILKLIANKRDEYFTLLDQQLFNYRYGYIFYEKQLRKAFPKAEDASLYPTREELFHSMSKLENPSQLTSFIKQLKEDLNEKKIFVSEEGLSTQDTRLLMIKNISKKLDEFKSKYPTLVDPEANVKKIREQLDKALNTCFDALFSLNNEIPDMSSGEVGPRSSLAKASDWSLIRKWLDKEYKNKKIRLVYKGTKDGMTAYAFHEKANNKGPTITIMKSKAGKIFGGFLPESWTSRNGYVNTSKSWLFSLTLKAKYVMNDPSTYAQYGGYDYSSYGPTFGGGHDIYLASDFGGNSNYCNRHSYNFTSNNDLTGGYNFSIEEIETFSIG